MKTYDINVKKFSMSNCFSIDLFVNCSEIVEGSGDEEFDQDAAINEAVNKVTELVTSWADNLEDIDMDLEINQMENEVTDEKAGKRKRKCEKCERKIFRARNSEFCESCQEEETVEVTTALTTPQSSISQSLIQNLKLNHNHHHNHRLVQKYDLSLIH